MVVFVVFVVAVESSVVVFCFIYQKSSRKSITDFVGVDSVVVENCVVVVVFNHAFNRIASHLLPLLRLVFHRSKVSTDNLIKSVRFARMICQN